MLGGGGQLTHQPGSGGDSNSTHYFLAASSIGNLKVWDTQDVLQPRHERIVSRNTINSCLWMGPPHVWITASSDGMLRLIWLDAGVQATSTATWTADGEPKWPVLEYAIAAVLPCVTMPPVTCMVPNGACCQSC